MELKRRGGRNLPSVQGMKERTDVVMCWLFSDCPHTPASLLHLPLSCLLREADPRGLHQPGSLASWLLIGLSNERHSQETGKREERRFSFAPYPWPGVALAVPFHSHTSSMAPATQPLVRLFSFAPCKPKRVVTASS